MIFEIYEIKRQLYISLQHNAAFRRKLNLNTGKKMKEKMYIIHRVNNKLFD